MGVVHRCDLKGCENLSSKKVRMGIRQYAFALDVMRRHDRRCDPHDMVAVSR